RGRDDATALGSASRRWSDRDAAACCRRAAKRGGRLWGHAAVAGVHEPECGGGRAVIEGRGGSGSDTVVWGDGADARGPHGQCRGGAAAARARRGGERAGARAGANGPDVGGGRRPCRRGGGTARTRRRRARAIDDGVYGASAGGTERGGKDGAGVNGGGRGG